MSQSRSKLRAITRLVALRQRLKEQSAAAVKQTRLEAAATESHLALPWLAAPAQTVAAELARTQTLRDMGYGHLAQLQATLEREQQAMRSRYRDFHQAEVLLKHARAQAAATLARREARDAEDWLRRQKKDEQK